MNPIKAIVLLFVMTIATSVSYSDDGATTKNTDYGGMELTIGTDVFIAVATDEVVISTDICFKEAGTFERKEEASPIIFSFTFSPYIADPEPIPDYDQGNHFRSDNPHSGHNSIDGARLKILFPIRC